MHKLKTPLILTLVVAIGAPILISHSAFAADANVTQVENFIRSVIKVIASLAGLVATGFFVAGGFGYITSSGNPETLERSKHTLLYASIGLAIVIAAFVISNIITNLAVSAFGS